MSQNLCRPMKTTFCGVFGFPDSLKYFKKKVDRLKMIQRKMSRIKENVVRNQDLVFYDRYLTIIINNQELVEFDS